VLLLVTDCTVSKQGIPAKELPRSYPEFWISNLARGRVMPKYLTDLGIEKKGTPKQRTFTADARCPGLFLVEQPTGKKSWIVARRLGSKFVKMKIGSFPAFKVEQARQEAEKYIAAFDRGEDPRQVRLAEQTTRQATQAETVSVVGEDWLRRDQAEKRTCKEIQNFLKNRLLPAWGERPISSITKRDCIAFVDKVAEETSSVRSRRIFSFLHRFFQWCLEQDILVHHPMNGMKKRGQENKRRRYLSNTEIKLFWEATEQMAYPFGPALQLLLLTGCRREEISALKWNEIKTDGIELSGDRVKRLPNAKDEGRIIPLSDKAREILKAIPRKSEYVFTTTGRSPISGWGKFKIRLDEHLKKGLFEKSLPFQEWRLHDLRRTLASNLQKMKVRTEAIETLLGHLETAGSRSGIIGVYQAADFSEEAIEAVEIWAEHVSQLNEGKFQEKILTLPKTRVS
jgi:integrase